MAIVFDTTIGGDSSTSYVLVDEFNLYVEKIVDDDGIPTSDQTTVIQKLLIAATDAVNNLLYSSDGSPTSSTQRLEYPRYNISNRRGVTIPDNIIPASLKDAVIEMAMFMHLNEMNTVAHDNWEDNIESTSIGSSISHKYKQVQKPTELVPNRVKQLIANITGEYPSNGITAIRG